MKRQQVEERVNVHGHDSMLAALFVHLVVVGDSPVINIEYPRISDGHTKGIAPDVFEHLTDTICRGLGMDDPVLVEALLAYSLRDGNTFFFQSAGHQTHETSPELSAHGGYGKEKRRTPATMERMPYAIDVNASARYNAVDMGVVKKIRSPRVENGCHARMESLLCSKSVNSAPSSFEHTVVEFPLIGHRNRMQARRHRENDMEVLHRDNLFPAELYPLLTFLLLALGTMSVTTAVIADMHIPALGTHLYMATKSTSPALSHVSESSSDGRYDLMLRKELISMTSDNLTNVKFGPHRLGGKMVSIRRTCFIGSMSAT